MAHPAAVVKNIHVRTASHHDIPEIFRLDIQAFGSDSYALLTWHQMLDLCGPMALVVDDPGGPALAGFALIAPTWEKGHGLLVGVAVDETLRRRGLGTALTREVIKSANGFDISTIRLTVAQDNPAVTIYRRLGFRVQDDVPDYDGTGRGRFVMELCQEFPVGSCPVGKHI